VICHAETPLCVICAESSSQRVNRVARTLEKCLIERQKFNGYSHSWLSRRSGKQSMGDKRLRERGAVTAEDVYRNNTWGGLLISREMRRGFIAYGRETDKILQLAFDRDTAMYTNGAKNQASPTVGQALLLCT